MYTMIDRFMSNFKMLLFFFDTGIHGLDWKYFSKGLNSLTQEFQEVIESLLGLGVFQRFSVWF